MRGCEPVADPPPPPPHGHPREISSSACGSGSESRIGRARDESRGGSRSILSSGGGALRIGSNAAAVDPGRRDRTQRARSHGKRSKSEPRMRNSPVYRTRDRDNGGRRGVNGRDRAPRRRRVERVSIDEMRGARRCIPRQIASRSAREHGKRASVRSRCEMMSGCGEKRSYGRVS